MATTNSENATDDVVKTETAAKRGTKKTTTDKTDPVTGQGEDPTTTDSKTADSAEDSPEDSPTTTPSEQGQDTPAEGQADKEADPETKAGEGDSGEGPSLNADSPEDSPTTTPSEQGQDQGSSTDGKTGSDIRPDVPKDSIQAASDPLTITVINHGASYYEMAIKKQILPGVNTLKFESIRQKRTVIRNIGSINGLNGGGRFTITKE